MLIKTHHVCASVVRHDWLKQNGIMIKKRKGSALLSPFSLFIKKKKKKEKSRKRDD
jgi:hypothetical protein